MVGVLGAIGGGGDARQSLKLVNQVGLVKITALNRQICPLGMRLVGDMVQGVLETLDAAITFGGNPHIMFKQLDKARGTDANFLDHIGNLGGIGVFGPLVQGKFNGRVAGLFALELSQ